MISSPLLIGNPSFPLPLPVFGKGLDIMRTRYDIAASLAVKNGLSVNDCRKFIRKLEAEITQALIDDGEVNFHGFASFKRRLSSAKRHMESTGEQKPYFYVTFKAKNTLKYALNPHKRAARELRRKKDIAKRKKNQDLAMAHGTSVTDSYEKRKRVRKAALARARAEEALRQAKEG